MAWEALNKAVGKYGAILIMVMETGSPVKAWRVLVSRWLLKHTTQLVIERRKSQRAWKKARLKNRRVF